MGASLFQIQDKSVLKNPEVKRRFSEEQFTASLLKGDFKKAEEWIPQYTEAGGDPVIAAEFHLKVLLYQHKFEEAFEQYKKMAELDSKYLKENPKSEAYVLPGMVQEFREKIDAAIEREKDATHVEE